MPLLLSPLGLLVPFNSHSAAHVQVLSFGNMPSYGRDALDWPGLATCRVEKLSLPLKFAVDISGCLPHLPALQELTINAGLPPPY